MKKFIFVFAFVLASSGLIINAQDECIPEEGETGGSSLPCPTGSGSTPCNGVCITWYDAVGKKFYMCVEPRSTSDTKDCLRNP